MRARWILGSAVALLVGLWANQARALLTIDQARELSQKTGRPIFAVAGSATWAPCRVLIDRLNTDMSLRPLVVQFVPLKVETAGPQWKKWASKYPFSGRGIPIIYVIRADGQMVYGKSGAVPDEGLAVFMQKHLAAAGRVLNDGESKLLDDALKTAKQAAADDPSAAVKALIRTKKLGPLGNMGSFAQAAVEADKLVVELTDRGKAALASAKSLAADGDKRFEGVLAMVEAKRIYGSLPDMRAELLAAGRELNRDPALREMLKPAEGFDRARSYLSMRSGKTRGIAALKQVVIRYPGSPAAELAKAELAKLSVSTADLGPPSGNSSSSAGPATASSPAEARKKASSYLRMARVFAQRRPEKARQYAQKVVDLVPGSEEARQAQALLNRLGGQK